MLISVALRSLVRSVWDGGSLFLDKNAEWVELFLVHFETKRLISVAQVVEVGLGWWFIVS